MPRTKKIADFGDGIHQKFIELMKDNLYHVEKVVLKHVNSPEGNYYLIAMIPKVKENRRSWQFTAKIQKDLRNPQKSFVFRRVEKLESGQDVIDQPMISDNFNYQHNCARWLYSILYEHEFDIDFLDVMLPPRSAQLQRVKWKNAVRRLEITVDREEQDRQLIIGWLANFKERLVNLVKITSESVRIEVKMSKYLKTVHTVEICGKSDIDWEWIYSTNTIKFIHSGSDDFVLTDDEIKKICEHYIDPKNKGTILIFDQGTVERGEELKKWLRETYSEHRLGVDYFQLRVGKNDMFYFQMKNGYLKFGKCTYLIITDANEMTFPQY